MFCKLMMVTCYILFEVNWRARWCTMKLSFSACHQTTKRWNNYTWEFKDDDLRTWNLKTVGACVTKVNHVGTYRCTMRGISFPSNVMTFTFQVNGMLALKKCYSSFPFTCMYKICCFQLLRRHCNHLLYWSMSRQQTLEADVKVTY